MANQNLPWDLGTVGSRVVVFLGAGQLGGRASWENLPAHLASLLEGSLQSQEVQGTGVTESLARTPGSSHAWLLVKTFLTSRIYLALPFRPFLIHFFHSTQIKSSYRAVSAPPPLPKLTSLGEVRAPPLLLPHALSLLRPLQSPPCRASRLTASPLLAHPLLRGHAPPSPGCPLWFLPHSLLCRCLPP